MEEHAAEWWKMLQIPDSYQYQKTIELICKYEFEKFDAELYRQANGPDTFQRVLKVFPKNCSRPLPAVAVPFYRPEKMIGFELDTGEILQNCIGIAMMAHLAQRGFIAASICNFDDLKELGSEQAVKAAGKLRTEGKTYVMQDGDVVEFKFNV